MDELQKDKKEELIPPVRLDPNEAGFKSYATRLADKIVVEATWHKINELGDPKYMSDENFARLIFFREVLRAKKDQGIRIAMKAVETFVPKRTETGQLQGELLQEMIQAVQRGRIQPTDNGNNRVLKAIETKLET